MSVLIDKLISRSDTQCEMDGKWYIAKGYSYWTFQLQWRRLKDALRILTGKSFACHYKIDEAAPPKKGQDNE